MKTRLSNSQSGAEELTNHNASCQALQVQHFDYDSDDPVFSGWWAASKFFFRFSIQFDFHKDRAEGGAETLTPPPIPLSCMLKLVRSSLALAPPPPPQPRSKIYCAGPVSLDRIALCFWIQLRLRPKWKPALNRWSTSDSFFLFFSNNIFVFMHLLISVYCITSKGAALYCLVPYATSRIWLSSFCRKRKGRLNNTSTQ